MKPSASHGSSKARPVAREILEPLDLRAAVAVALCYFAALRPAEARGLKWEDWTGAELDVRRSVWRNHVGETKTEESAASVPVIEPLRGLLEKLRAQSAGEYILSNGSGKPLSLDSLNVRVIAPVLKAAGIEWRGYYPCRRGISSLVTDSSKNALNSTGLLRHSTPITALKHYTRAQKDSIQAALKTVEEMATKSAEGDDSMTVPSARCTSRPDCPCEFCIRTRAEGRSERDTQDQSAREFIDAYLRESVHLSSPRDGVHLS
jgi:integrase